MNSINYKNEKKIIKNNLLYNSLFVIYRLIIGYYCNCISLICFGLYSIGIVFVNISMYISIFFLKKPEDNCHNYGHGKYKSLIMFITCIIIALIILHVIKYLVNRIYTPYITDIRYILIVVIASFLINMMRYLLDKKNNIKEKLYNHMFIKNDILLSIILLIMICLYLIGIVYIDLIMSFIIVIITLLILVRISKRQIDILTDRAIDEEKRNAIIDIIESDKRIKNYHKFKGRIFINKIIIDFHIQIDKLKNTEEAHDISEELETKIKNSIGHNTIITIHIEPYI